MSFDLAFWVEEPTPVGSAAAETYDRLVDGELNVVGAHVAVGKFFDEVVSTFPNRPAENPDSSPWASPIYKTEECVIVTISGSRSADVAPVLCRMASLQGLITFDPQSGEVMT